VRWQQGKLDAFESVHVLGLVYFVYFGLGAIWLVQDPVRNAYDIYLVPYVPRAVVYCTLGFGALLFTLMSRVAIAGLKVAELRDLMREHAAK